MHSCEELLNHEHFVYWRLLLSAATHVWCLALFLDVASMSVVVPRFVSLKEMMRGVSKERGNFFPWGEGCVVVFLYHVYGSCRNSCNKHFWNIFFFIGMSIHIFGPTFHASFFLSYYLSLLLSGSFVLIELLVFSELCLVLWAHKKMCVTDFFFSFWKNFFLRKLTKSGQKSSKNGGFGVLGPNWKISICHGRAFTRFLYWYLGTWTLSKYVSYRLKRVWFTLSNYYSNYDIHVQLL